MKKSVEIRYLNGVKAEVQSFPGNSTDCLLSIAEADGSMIDGKVWFRVYTKQQFDLIRTAFPNIGWRKAELGRLDMRSDLDKNTSPDVADWLI